MENFKRVTLAAVTLEQAERVGRRADDPIVLSSTKYYGLVPSDEYFKNRTIYSDNLSNYKVVRRDWFAYATNHLSEGSIGLQERFNEACVSPIYTVFSAAAEVHPPLLFRLLKSWQLLNAYKLHEQATVDRRGAVRYRDFRKIAIDLPPLPEQRQIAAILDTIDDAIQKTEQVIAKLKQVKQGLLHDLLTRGIDDNGELRCPDRHPEQFKDSPLGRIPRGWEVVALGIVIPYTTYGISESLDSGPGTPILRMMNFKDGEADLSDLKFSRSKGARELLLQPGDVLFNRTNSIDHVGRTGIWRSQIEIASFASYLVRLELDSKRLRGEFLNQWLNWEVTQLRIRRVATPGVHQVNINPTNLRRTTIALPTSLAEQDQVTASISVFNARLVREEAELNKLRLLKAGLMEDLLTGRVRVTKLLEDATP